jgi:chromosomal replication initiation ATPase DnaA
VEAGVAKEDEEFLVELERSPRSIGDEKFRKWVDECYEELLERQGKREDVSFRRVRGKQTPEAILKAVAKCARVKKEELLVRRRDSGLRAVASRMLCKYGGLTQREAASVLGVKTGVAVSCQLKKLKTLLETDQSMRRLVERLEKRFSTKERA